MDHIDVSIETLEQFKERFEVGGYVKHFKRETVNTYQNPLKFLYKIQNVGVDSEDLTCRVVYESLYELGRVWVRPIEDFISEVDHEKYPDIKQKYKFETVDTSAIVYKLMDYVKGYLVENKLFTSNSLISKISKDKSKVITICGSTKFKDEIIQANRKLSMKGNIVLSCPFFNHTDGEEFSNEDIGKLTDLHLRRIDMSDAIYVVNKDGYIGDGTRAEIYYALYKGKEVIYMEEVNLK